MTYQARFDDEAHFLDARFDGDARFDRAQFNGDTQFGKAQFLKPAVSDEPSITHSAN